MLCGAPLPLANLLSIPRTIPQATAAVHVFSPEEAPSCRDALLQFHEQDYVEALLGASAPGEAERFGLVDDCAWFEGELHRLFILLAHTQTRRAALLR